MTTGKDGSAARTMEPEPMSDEEAVRAVLRDVERIARQGAPQVNVDVQVAAQKVKATLKDLRADAALYGRVKAVAGVGEFDFGALDRLQRNGSALWLLGHRAKLEREQSARLLDEATLARAMTVRTELHRVVVYHFGRDPKESAAVAAIGNGPDHLVLANDLRYLHDLCAREKKRLANDANCPPALVLEARTLADGLRDALAGRASNGLREVDRVAALWSLVKVDHDALVTVLRFLLRETPDGGKGRFPRLGAGPGRAKRASDNDNEGDDDGEAPANDPTDPAPVAPTDAKPVAPTDAKPAADPPAPAAPSATKPRAAMAVKKPARKRR